MENKQTAVEWLFNQIKKSSEKKDNINNDHLFFYRMLEQAKAMEKEQMKQALLNQVTKLQKQFEEYYNENYKSE